MDEQQSTTEQALNLIEQADATPSGDSTGGQVEQQVAPPPASFDIDGEQVTTDQIKTWKQGNMMQSDYTRKTQELSQQRDQLKPYMEMATYLQSNPEKAQTIYNYLSGNQGLEQQQVDPKEVKINQLERAVQGLIYQNSQQEANQRLKEVKGNEKYAGLFDNPVMEEMLLSRALQAKDYDLKNTAETIHKTIMELKASTKIETEKQIKENLSAPTRKSVVTTGGTIEPPASFNPSRATKRDLSSKALEMLG